MISSVSEVTGLFSKLAFPIIALAMTIFSATVTGKILKERRNITVQDVINRLSGQFLENNHTEKIETNNKTYYTDFKKPTDNNDFNVPKSIISIELLKTRTILMVKGYNTVKSDEILNIVYTELQLITEKESLSDTLKTKFINQMFTTITEPLTNYLNKINNDFIEAETKGTMLDMSLYDIELEVLSKTMLTHLEKIRNEK